MNAEIVNPFVNAVAEVMPQLGFREVKRGKLRLCEQVIACRGITVIISLAKQIKGNIAYNMTADAAKKFASTMMMGMAVNGLDELAQSAISEMINIVTANAAMHLEKNGISAEISPPTVIVGAACTAKFSTAKYLLLEMFVDSELIEVNIALDSN